MSDIDKQGSSAKAVPFFARYLEGQLCKQLSEEETAAIKGGTIYKIKADQEDDGGGVVTQKYPSDQEDDGGGVVTQKYPSDQEDSGTGFPDITFPTAQEWLDKFFGRG